MDLMTPVGRIVQGSVALQAQKDMETNQPLLNDDGAPQMGVFLALAFPKVLPTGQPNTEFDNFRLQLAQVAAAAPSTLKMCDSLTHPEYPSSERVRTYPPLRVDIFAISPYRSWLTLSARESGARRTSATGLPIR